MQAWPSERCVREVRSFIRMRCPQRGLKARQDKAS